MDRVPPWQRFPFEVFRGIRLVDVSNVLPRDAERGYPRRDPAGIRRVVIHQTQGQWSVEPAIALAREASYFVEKPDAHGGGIDDGRGWPGFGYTFWAPWWPELDEDGRLVAYRCQPDNVKSNHTRGANVDGVAIAFQGRFAPCRAADCEPSDHQRRLFAGLVGYCLNRYRLPLSAIEPHSVHGKADCPGDALASWIGEFQRNGGVL